MINDFMDFITNEVIEKGKRITLPASCGKFYVEGKKIVPHLDEEGILKGMAPDWHGSRKLWERDPEARDSRKMLFHFNEHTRGVRYRFKWEVPLTLGTNRIFYVFILSRNNRRRLAKNIFGGQEYHIKAKKQ
jgi:hypothetical protein